MFKKHPNTLKTSSPLKSSERRKMRNAVATQFALDESVANDLVPDPTLSVAFKSHLDELGVIYLANGDPIWFQIDRSDEYIPSIYTLHKHPELLPTVYTGSGVIPALLNGADLMIPGVFRPPRSLMEGQLVSISRFSHDCDSGEANVSLPIAVGHAALSFEKLNSQEKGKAVYVLHTWKDFLWSMGHAFEGDVPSHKINQQPANQSAEHPAPETPVEAASTAENTQLRKASPEETTQLLRSSLFRAIASKFSGESSTPLFPIPSSTFLSSYILPCRPSNPNGIISSAEAESYPPLDPFDINIKNSTFKSLTAFLKAVEKENVLTLKQPQKHSNQAEMLITKVNSSHHLVLETSSFKTIGDVEAKAAKATHNQEKVKEMESQQAKTVEVVELYQAGGSSLSFFEKAGSVSTIHTEPQIKQLLNEYILKEKLVDPSRQAFVFVDDLLTSFMPAKQNAEQSQFKREDLLTALISAMQVWHEITSPGKEAVRKKGKLIPIQLAIKMRQGKKAVTRITGFETFLIINADVLAEDLKKLCAGSTSVAKLPGRNSGTEVTVQGKHTGVIANYLHSKGIPRKWINDTDPKSSKKK